MPRAILIDPDEDPQWINLDVDVRHHLARLLPGGHETVEIHRDDWTHFNDGPGIRIGIHEDGVGRTRNNLATRIINKLDGGWPVNGRAIFMGLHDADIVDLADEQWAFLNNIATA